MITRRSLCVCLGACLVAGCKQTIPPEALQLQSESLQQRQLQTRKYDTTDEPKLLAASAAVLQDLGFNIDESETHVGLIVASKDRDATETGQVVGAVFVAILFGVAMPIDRNQKIRASIVTRPGPSNDTFVRITFQRIVWNTRNEVSKTEPLNEPQLYQEFFNKLSQSVFLNAQEI